MCDIVFSLPDNYNNYNKQMMPKVTKTATSSVVTLQFEHGMPRTQGAIIKGSPIGRPI